MSNFKHLDGMVALLSEVYEINERIMTGDICSAKTAIASGKMKKLLQHYHEALHEDGAVLVQGFVVVLQELLHLARGDSGLRGADVPGHDALVDLVDFGQQGDHAVEVLEITHGARRRG